MQAISFKFWVFILFISCTAFTCFNYQTAFEEVKLTSDFKDYKNGFHFVKVVATGEILEERKLILKKITKPSESFFIRHYSTYSEYLLLHRDCIGRELIATRTDQISNIIISSKPLMDLVKIEFKDNGTNEKVFVSDTKEMCFELIDHSPFTTSFTMRDTSFFIPVFPDSINPVFIKIGEKFVYEKELEVKREVITVKI